MRDLAPRAAHGRRRGQPTLTDPVARIERSPAARAARSALSGEQAWLVGGPVRDAFLDRVGEVDVVVAGDPGAAARALADGAEAVLIGEQGDERILAEEVARNIGTINYEITCGISARVPRE